MHMIIKLRCSRGPAHYRVTVFLGADEDHFQCCGDLCFSPEEAERFRHTISQGIQQVGGFSAMLESGWMETSRKESP